MSHTGATIFAGRCPECGKGRMFSSWFVLRERCPECGVVFMRDPGSWTGSTVVAYMIGSVFFLVLTFGMWVTGNIVKHSEWLIATATCAFVVLIYRFVKAAWVAMGPEPHPHCTNCHRVNRHSWCCLLSGPPDC